MNGYELKQKVHSGGIVYGTMLSMSRNPTLDRADVRLWIGLRNHG